MADPQKVTPKKADEWRPVFLATLRDSGNVRAACKQAGITRKTVYQHREQSKEFAAQWAEAMEDAIDVLEAVALQRAKATSDTLLIFLLKAHRPDKYRDTVNLRLFVEREAAAMAEQTGVSAPDIMAEFNTLIGAPR